MNGRFLGARATGVQRFAAEIVRRLWARAGGGVLLLPRGVVPPPDLPASVRVVRGRTRGHLWERLELPRRARGSGCDVVLHPANTLPRGGGPHVVVVHDVEPLERPELFAPAFRGWYRWGVAPAVRRAARVVTVSSASARALARVLALDPSRIRVADQGASPFADAAPDGAVAAVRARYGLRAPYLLAVGGGDPRKNVPFLVRTLARWRARTRGGEALPPPPELVVVGEGSGRIFAAAGEPAAGDGVHRIGRVDDETLRALYTGAAALAFPSVSEGFGRPPLEAMACGTPVVAAPYAAAPEVLGDAAALVPLDADLWVDALVAVAREGGDAASARRARGRRQAASHSWDAGADAILAACREVAG